MRGKKIKLLASVIGIIFVVIAVIAGFGWKEHKLEDAQQEFTSLIEAEEGNYNENKVVLSSTTKEEAQEMADAFGGKLRITANGKFAVITLPDGMTVSDIAEKKEFRKYHDRLLLDYNNYGVKAEETSGKAGVRANYQVNDPMYPQQKYLDYLNIGNSWNSTRGKKGNGDKVKVAVIDTGIDTDHPEFYDAEGNCVISNNSYDATSDRTVAQNGISVIEDANGHGTIVAGIIASQMDDNGIAGIAPDVELLVIKCDANEQGEFKSSSDIVFAIYYAIEQGADVINMSLGGSDSRDMKEALELAVESDIVTVASAGNDGTADAHYPAAYDTTIGVGALEDGSWELANYSNYGVNVDMVAPGTALTTVVGGGYSYRDGTSISSPIVAAAVALYKAKEPYADYQTIKANLMAAGKDLGEPGVDIFYGYGALDMNAFLCEDKGTITYDYCTDEIASTSQTFVRQHTIQTVPEPERTKVVFDDWYYDKAYTQVFDYDNWYSTVFVEDVTLYAKWVNEDDEDDSAYDYTTLEDGTIEIQKYKGKRRYLTIPDTIDGKVVSSIGFRAFYRNSRLREVVLPEGLVTIKEDAFDSVSNMRKITFKGKNLKTIGKTAFMFCTSLRTISLPDSVETIEELAFDYCYALTSIEVSENSQLKKVGRYAFAETAISYFYLPANLLRDGFEGSAFENCIKMRGVGVHPENTAFKVVNHVLFSKDGSCLVYYPAGMTGKYKIPDSVKRIGTYAFNGSVISEIDLNCVETIEASAFEKTSKLNSILFPETLTELGDSAFRSSAINTLILSSNLEKIPASAFANTKLSTVRIGAKVKKICSKAFWGCGSLKELIFEENSELESIESEAFERCGSLQNVILPESLKKIESEAFSGCSSITELIIPKNVSLIEADAFSSCTALRKLTFAEECVLQEIPRNCFRYCTSLHEVNISAKVLLIDQYAFGNCTMLSTLNFAEKSALETIEEYCFYGDTNLKEMQIPESVQRIGDFAYAFSGLERAELTANITEIGDGAFGACASLKEFSVSEENSVYTGKENALFDKSLQRVYCVSAAAADDYVLPESIQSIEPYAFYYDKMITSVQLPEGLQEIRHDAFYSCNSLSKIEIPSNVTNIGRKAFEDCHKLTSVTFAKDSHLQRLGIYTFVNCGLSEIVIPDSVEEMAQYVFLNCGNLKKVTFEKNSRLTYISAYLFSDTNVEQIIFEEGSALKNLQAHAFEGAYQLKSVDFGNAELETIENYAFYNCDKLEEIHLPDTVISIGRYAFYNCAMLDRMDIPMTVEHIGTTAFYGTNQIKLYFAADILPTDLENGWDKGVAGYYLQAKEGVSNDEWEYVITGADTIALIRYKGDKKELDLETVDGYTVEKIGAQCFYENTALTKVTIGSKVKEIGNYAFYGCSGIESLVIPASVEIIGNYTFADTDIKVVLNQNSLLEKIGEYAFSHNGTESIVLPDSVKEIGEGAFYESELVNCEISKNSELKKIGSLSFCGTALQSVYLPETLSYVGSEAFKDTSVLKKIEIADGDADLKLENSAFEKSGISQINLPKRISYIGEYAFAGCSELENIYVDEKNRSYSDLEGVLCNYDGTTLIQYPSGRSGAYEVPQKIKILTYAAFKDAKKLTEVRFAEDSTVRTIGWKMFSGCENLEKIYIPDTVVSFDYYAFENCTKLSDVVLNMTSQLMGVSEGAFYECTSLKNISFPDSVKEIGEYAFYNCTALENIPMKETSHVTGIFDYAFYGCSGISSIPHFSELTEIGAYAFAYTNVTEYTVPASVKQIASTAFSGCENLIKIECEERNEVYTSLNGVLYEKGVSDTENMESVIVWPFGKKIILGEGKTELDSEDTKILGGGSNAELPVKIAEGVTRIGDRAFYGCNGLTSIEIPATVTVIGNGAFMDCHNLQKVMLNERLLEIGRGAFAGCTSLKRIVIPESVTTIGREAFQNCDEMEAIVIRGNKLPESLGENWNGDCIYIFGENEMDIVSGKTADGLKYVINANQEVTILGYAGKEKKLQIPDEINHKPVVAIRRNAFAGKNLTSISIPNSIMQIESYTFKDCRELKKITIPGSVRKIGEYAFENCYGLEKVIMEEGIQKIGNGVFMNCNKLSSVTIPQSVEVIGHSVFYWCTKLKTAGEIGGGYNIEFGWKESIPSNVFYNCYGSVETIVIPNGVKRIGSSAFAETRSIKKIIIPDSVTEIERNAFNQVSARTAGPIGGGYDYEFGWKDTIPDGAFNGCDMLTSIFIPQSIKNIANIRWTSRLVAINVDLDNEFYSSVDGVLFNKDQSKLVKYPDGKAGEYVVPEGVIEMNEAAFHYAYKLTSIKIAQSVKKMGTFYECAKLKTVWIYSKEIASKLSNAYIGNYANASIIIPSKFTEISSYITKNFNQTEEITDQGVSYTIYSNHAHHWQLKSETEKIECQKDGKRVYVCSECSLKRVEVISAHEWNEWTIEKEAGCTENGQRTHQCVKCGYSETEVIEALEHQYEESVTPATCTENGKRIQKCTRCGYQEEEILQAKGHQYQNGICTRCGQLEKKTGTCGENLSWSLEEGTLSIFGKGEIPNLSEAEEQPWYQYSHYIKKICIEEGISNIGDKAFYSCPNLTKVELPQSLTRIGEWAFAFCYDLETIIPKNVETIGRNAFSSCRNPIMFQSAKLPQNIDYSFLYDTTTILNVSRIGKTEDGKFFYYVTNDNHIGVYAYKGGEIEIVIPEMIENLPVEKIEARAFYRNGIKKVTIPNTVTVIGKEAFSSSSVEDVELSKTLTEIGERAFEGCRNLHHIYIPESVKRIGSEAFWECDSLTVMLGSENLPSYSRSNEEVVMNVSNIGETADGMFCYYLTKEGYAGIYQYKGSEANVEIPETVEGASVKKIGPGIFKNQTKLTKVAIPDSVTVIGNNIFYGCTNLREVSLSKNLTEIGNDAFMSCENLKNLTIPDKMEKIGRYAFRRCKSISTITVPKGVKELSGAFWECTSLKVVTLSGGLTNIDSYTFRDCTALEQITLPESLEEIGFYAFDNCTSLKSIKIPKKVSTIWETFKDCTNMRLVQIESPSIAKDMTSEDACGYLGKYADTIVIPKAISEVGDYILSYQEAIEFKHQNTEYTAYSNHAHQWKETEQLDYAACQKDGNVVYSCTECGLEKTEWTAAHEMKEWTIEKEATCTESGERTGQCVRCGYKVSETIEPLGHVYEENIQEPTCTEAGKKVRKCTRCGEEETEILDALGHEYTETIQEATCTETGKIERKCTRCGEEETEILDALGHAYIETIKEPTCTKRGEKSSRCTRCGIIITDVMNALGHDYKETIQEATCTEAGKKVRECTRCGDRKEETIKALGHQYKETIKEPTCTEPGEKTSQCTRCGDKKTEILDALGHEYEGVTCIRCGKMLEDTGVCGDHVTWSYKEYVLTISGEGAMQGYSSEEERPWNSYALYINKVYIEKGITAIGEKTFAGCENLYFVQIDAPDLVKELETGEEYGELCKYAKTIAVPKSEQEAGSYITKQYKQKMEFKSQDIEYVAYSNHEHIWQKIRNSGYVECVKDGDIVYSCKECGFEKNEWTPAHDFGTPVYTWSKDNTTVTAKRVCSRNSKHIEEETGAAVEKEVKAPTCTTSGQTIYEAEFENEAFKTQRKTITGEKALGHDFKDGACTRCHAEKTGKWVKAGTKWWYRYSDGSYPAGMLCKINNIWYSFDSAGWMQTGWVKRNNVWYYFGKNGEMKTNWQKLGSVWYYFKENGVMQTGWMLNGGTWYYMDPNGKMLTGLIVVANEKYHMDENGKMQTGWQMLNNTWYYFKQNGKMATDWQKLGGKWYYLNTDGKMATGWKYINNAWYYFKGNGNMATDWQKIGEKWYYFDADGKMATNTWIGNWYVDGSGAWKNSK